MKAASTALLSLINSGNFVYATLYTINTKSGPVLRYSDADVDILGDGTNIWSPKGPRVIPANTTSTAHWKIGLDVDTWQIEIAPRLVDPVTQAAYPDSIGSQPWLAAASAGVLDNATITVSRVYFGSWPTYQSKPIVPVGTLVIFAGPVSDVDVGQMSAMITAQSWGIVLTRDTPKNLFQSQCSHALYDAGCTLAASAFAVNGTVGTGSTNSSINSTAAAPPGSGTFALGRITMTSGLNSGYSRSVRSWSGGVFTLLSPFAYTVSPGDTFTAYAGCDKTLATCALFSNTLNYGGEPFIPAPETAI